MSFSEFVAKLYVVLCCAYIAMSMQHRRSCNQGAKFTTGRWLWRSKCSWIGRMYM